MGDVPIFERLLLLSDSSEKEDVIDFEAKREESEAIVAQGKKQFENKQYLDALDSFDKALTLTPDSSQANYYKGLILNYLERPHDAAKILRMASEKDPENEEILKELLALYKDINDDISRAEISIKLYELFIKKDNYERRKNMLVMLFWQGQDMQLRRIN